MKIESKHAKSDLDFELFETQKLSSWSQHFAPMYIPSQAIVLANSDVTKATKDSNKNVANTISLIETFA